jgi:hypothetical protein
MMNEIMRNVQAPESIRQFVMQSFTTGTYEYNMQSIAKKVKARTKNCSYHVRLTCLKTSSMRCVRRLHEPIHLTGSGRD